MYFQGSYYSVSGLSSLSLSGEFQDRQPRVTQTERRGNWYVSTNSHQSVVERYSHVFIFQHFQPVHR